MNKNILIAEDSSVVSTILKKILIQENFKVSIVKNGKSVLKKLEEESFNLILMDINMPILDGMETTKIIRKMGTEVGKIPIFAITGNIKNYTIEDFKAVGINEYLKKPLDFDLLISLINRYIN